MRDRGSPPSSLCEDKTFMGAAPLSFWSLVGELKFSLGDLVSWNDYVIGKKGKSVW